MGDQPPSQQSLTNPKSEYRNPKQTQRKIKVNGRKSKTPNPKKALVLGIYLF
jgi:hypothetical protein